MPDRESTSPAITDSDKLRILAVWFDMWDAKDDARRRAILDDQSFPGKNGVQVDLRRWADDIADLSAIREWYNTTHASDASFDHDHHCPAYGTTDAGCDCGWQAAKMALNRGGVQT